MPACEQAGTAEPDAPPGPWPQQPFRRGWRFNWPGVGIMVLYCLAFVFYLYIRIRYTLDLGAYVWRAPRPAPRAVATSIKLQWCQFSFPVVTSEACAGLRCPCP